MPTLRFATDPTWPPMEFEDDTGKLVGFSIDMVREVASAAGFRAEFIEASWDGIFAGLIAGDYDAIVSSITITKERQQLFDFSIPYINGGQVLLVPYESTATSLSDLNGTTVGAQYNTTGAYEVAKYGGIQLQNYDSLQHGLPDLANGLLGGFVVDLALAAYAVHHDERYQGRLKIVGAVLDSEQYGIAVHKGNQEVLSLINQGIEIITANGRLDELKTKWGLSTPPTTN